MLKTFSCTLGVACCVILKTQKEAKAHHAIFMYCEVFIPADATCRLQVPALVYFPVIVKNSGQLKCCKSIN